MVDCRSELQPLLHLVPRGCPSIFRPDGLSHPSGLCDVKWFRRFSLRVPTES